MSSDNKTLAVEGVEVVIEMDGESPVATVRTRGGKQWSGVQRGKIGDVLGRARELSLQSGLGGYYGIRGLEQRLGMSIAVLEGGVLAEIERQLADLRPKSGMRWGFNPPPFTADELAEIPAAQQQISDLVGLRDNLSKLPPRRAELEGRKSTQNV